MEGLAVLVTSGVVIVLIIIAFLFKIGSTVRW